MQHFSERALLTDFYELAMLQGYFSKGMNETAVFEFFVRTLPPSRHFLLAAGLAQLVSFLSQLRFTEEDLSWLSSTGRFSIAFIASLRGLRFSGDLDAVPEGSLIFADEPLVRITAPLREAQLIESRLMNLLHYQTLIASKAARCVLAAPGKQLIDFGLRRAHGAEAALMAARASYLAGFDGTATTLAGMLFGIPVFGTMAHSFVQAFDSQTDAFAAFAENFPGHTSLLIDTYDTQAAAALAAHLHKWLRDAAPAGLLTPGIQAVRLDSGDLGPLAHQVRRILDQGGAAEVGIFVSGNLDEWALQRLLAQQAPIDGFGMGSQLDTAADAPYLDCAYKLVDYAGRARRKRSSGKANWPGRKQVFRSYDKAGYLQRDTLALHDEHSAGEALLRPVLRRGRVVAAAPSLAAIRAHAAAQLTTLPPPLRALEPATARYMPAISPGLQALVHEVDAQQARAAAADQARWGNEDE